MFTKKKYPRLVVASGADPGKAYRLKKDEYTIGSHKKCSIRISGDYISELHTRIQLNDSGKWVLTNNSPNGTYVNQQQVESIELEQFTIIQCGTENSFEFHPVGFQDAKDASDKTGDTVGHVPTKKKSFKWPLLIGGIFLLYLPLFLFLKNLGDDIGSTVEAPVMTLTDIEEVSEATHSFLSQLKLKSRNSTNNDLSKIGSVRALGLYDSLIQGVFSNESEKAVLISEIVNKSKTYLTLAHHYLRMDLNQQAIESLKEAMSVVPDHRNPSTGFAAKAISSISVTE